MFDLFFPDENHDSIHDLDLSSLMEKGYKNILIDIDNTITHWRSNDISHELRSWVQKHKDMGYSIFLFSNGKVERTANLAKSLSISAIPMAGKPRRSIFRKALRHIDGRPHNTIMIGDQMLTDVLGGNRMGLYTILVNPISDKEFFGTKINRFIERLLGRR